MTATTATRTPSRTCRRRSTCRTSCRSPRSTTRAACAGFSNYGKKTIDIAAPGEGILSAVPAEAGYPQGWAWMDGTSMAAPHVTGTAALVASVFPALAADPNGLRHASWRPASRRGNGRDDRHGPGGRCLQGARQHGPDRQRPVELRVHRGHDDGQLQHPDPRRLGERHGRSERRGRVQPSDADRSRTVGHGHRVDDGAEHLADPDGSGSRTASATERATEPATGGPSPPARRSPRCATRTRTRGSPTTGHGGATRRRRHRAVIPTTRRAPAPPPRSGSPAVPSR